MQNNLKQLCRNLIQHYHCFDLLNEVDVEAILENNVKKTRANLEVFATTLQELAAADRDIIIVTSDSRGSGKLVPFGQTFPKQVIEIGIAEQNLVGVAAGLASAGKKAFAVSPACFLTARALEQIKNDVAYSDNPVKLIGISAGVSYGALGSTHHSLHDFAVLRAINNITIVAPADNYETAQSIKLAAAMEKPVYLRFGKKNMPDLDAADQSFQFGKGRIIREGENIAFIATGETVYPALQAAKKLALSGVESTVISMHTIKPLDYELLEATAKKCNCMITVEEHSVFGGLGEACASFLLQKGIAKPFRIVAIPDEYTITGSQNEIFDHYGISEDGLLATALQLVKK
jgi:transketolase